MASFVSATEIAAAKRRRKEQKRSMRREILKEAEESYYEERRRKERKSQRGEDTWMAGGVTKRLGLAEASDASKGTKGKTVDTKQDRKRDRKRYRKEMVDPSRSGSEEEWEGVWVESGIAGAQATARVEDAGGQGVLKRDEWMTVAVGPSALSMSVLEGRPEKGREEENLDQRKRTVDTASGQHPLELNPYWKEGGSGLPQDREHSSRDRKRSKVGDGGRSWILRAYKRAIQAAEEEGRSLEEVASERWGSMGKLQSLLQSAGINPAYPDHSKTGKKELLFSNIADRRDYSMERDYDGKGEEKGKGKGRMGGKKCANPDHYLPKKGTHVEKFLRPGESGPKLPSSSLVSLGPSPSSSSQHWRKTVSAGSPTGCADIPSHSCIRVSEHGPEHSNASMSMERNPTPCDRKHGSIGEEQGGSESVTDADMNAVSAKLMKAEMRGRSDEVERLTKELGELRQARERQAVGPVVQPVPGRGEGKGGHGDGARELLLATTDRFGHTRPVKLSSSAVATASSHASGRMRTHAKKGRKDKFFADDDQYSLSALVKQERQTTAEEMHAAIANMSAKFVPAGIAGETVDDAVDSAAASKLNPGKEGQRRQQRAMLESRQQTEALDKCRLCLGSPHFSKSLLVAVGLAAYLAVPAYQSLVEGHCLIVPMEHASSCLVLDENVWSEMQIFRKGLVHMFAGQDKDVVFMETCRNLRFKTHTVVEAIPLPRDAGALAPMYFKKAILESDEEWAQNRKLIDTSKKGLRHSIPAGLPYFSIEFGMDGGFGHVIEDLDKFPAHFGAEVVGGLLEVEPRLWLRPPPESFEARRQKVEELSANWAPFDWTQQLKDK